MQVIRITDTVFETDGGGNAIAKYLGGSIQPINEDTKRQVLLNNAEEIEAPDDYVKALAAAEAAQAAADKAAAKAEAANEAAAVAKAAADVAGSEVAAT